MNDGQDPYDPYARDPYAQEPQIVGYDAYGQPVYQSQGAQQGYDPSSYYGQQQGQQQDGYGYGYDPYGQVQQGQQAPTQYPQTQQYDPYYGQQQHYPQQEQYGQQGYDYAAPAPASPAAPAAPAPPAQDDEPNPYEELAELGRDEPSHAAPAGASEGPGKGKPGPDAEGEEYRTEQFSFVEDPDEDSEDVIDWLKFAETRSERRDERRRKGRNRFVALIVVLVLAAVGGVGYLWYAGMLPGLSADGDAQTAAGPQKRDVIVVHLRELKGGRTSTALLVDNETTKKGTTVLLPNALSVSTEDGGSTTLGKSVTDEGSDATRDSLSTLLGSKIQGTWRLDTPYLENLVELVGGITLDTDTTVPATRKGEDPLVKRGKEQVLSGQAAVAYATYRAPGEAQTKQLARFGQVMDATLKKVSSDTGGATRTVEQLAQIPDPSLSEQQLGASLARLAGQAKGGDHDTMMLPVQGDGTLSARATDRVVKDVLGGTVKNTDPGSAARVSVTSAGGVKDASGAARVALVNGGFTVVAATEGGSPRQTSRVTYADAGQAGQAKEVAKTLGLPATSVTKGRVAANADVTVVLGADYDPQG
ncbi:LCP family protein [Streptomyces sp. NBRC 110028]|uniref:LCP family protein n=1 Tax=Streptomyces sp. NBRC 110028 TaxID=1621260 RepID=UPI0006E12C6B|nr:LCP family protein [Streptomyces sp. NBRC 110028]